jgi:arginine decarboxylase
MIKPELLDRWKLKNSEDLYGIKAWGASYFTINEKGEVAVTPFVNNPSVSVSLIDIIKGIKERGMDAPVLLRFENLLDSQITLLNESFRKAIDEAGYRGKYQGVYPIKVNQQQQVLKEVTRFGERYHHGLEVGSKPELIAALSVMKDKEACLVCNGYKDEEFIDLGLYATKMGFNCFFVVEIPGEVELILQRSRKLGINPNIGVRLKLASRAGGHWTESGGDRSIFGLNVSQVIDVVDYLKKEEMLDSLKLLHYHLGSQIPNIRDIRSAVVEAARVYAELVKEGAPMGYLDMGGGLAVDYDGSKTNYSSSRNYSLGEYCADIVEVVLSIMNEHEITHPTIITESGRAVVAYYSVLLFNVLDTSTFEHPEVPEKMDESTHEQISNLHEVYKGLSVKNLQESFNDAIYYRDLIRDHFKHGQLSLRERSLAESIFWNIITRISGEKGRLKRVYQELEGIEDAIADIYYCNFSVFQSVPDSWAIDQLFPIMPIHRLQEMPTRKAVIADITCDCDGKIDRFIDTHDVGHSIRLHTLEKNSDYYLGVFLVGAYQETLGDLHNLFGDTNVVSIQINESGNFDIVREIEGDSVEDVLSYVEYDTKHMVEDFKHSAEMAIREGLITTAERRNIINAYQNGLRGYTYYEKFEE